MRKVLVVALILTMVFGTIAASAQVNVPPGQAKKGMTQAMWMNLMQIREAQEDDDMEGLYGPMGLLPPGLMNKGTPPGLLNNGKVGLPPGLVGRDVLPPGIEMRFMETWQWQYRWGPEDKEEVEIYEAGTRQALLDLLEDEDVEMILLTDGFTITEPIVLEGDREVWINGNNKLLVADVDFEGWMIEVTNGTHLHLVNARLDAEGEDDLEGIIWVEEGSTLTARRNTLRNAAVGFGVEVEEYEEDDEKALLNNNWFFNVTDRVVFYDLDGDVLYPEED